MKRYLIILLLPVVSLFFSACSDDDELSSTSVVREATTEENDFDRWLTRNYVEPYNILFKYRFEDIESSMDYYLTPASYEQSVAMAKLVLHMCLEAYNGDLGPCLGRSEHQRSVGLVGIRPDQIEDLREIGLDELRIARNLVVSLQTH